MAEFSRIIYEGLDVHKDAIAVACARSFRYGYQSDSGCSGSSSPARSARRCSSSSTWRAARPPRRSRTPSCSSSCAPPSSACLGVAAPAIGAAFIGWQRAAWIALGLLYAAIGVLYLARRRAVLEITVGTRPTRGHDAWGSAALGLLFGLNVPACATPLLLALFAGATTRGAGGATLPAGFASLALFGAALSLPLVIAVVVPAARRALDSLAGLSARVPRATGVAFGLLGVWTVLSALRFR